MDFRDWFVLLHTNAAGIAATVFVFKHPDPLNFVTWATMLGTIVTFYHLFVIKDAKTPDAP